MEIGYIIGLIVGVLVIIFFFGLVIDTERIKKEIKKTNKHLEEIKELLKK